MTEFDPQRGLDFPIIDGQQSSMRPAGRLRRCRPGHRSSAGVPHRGLRDLAQGVPGAGPGSGRPPACGPRRLGPDEPGRPGQPLPALRVHPRRRRDRRLRGLRRAHRAGVRHRRSRRQRPRADRARRSRTTAVSCAGRICATSSTSGWPRAMVEPSFARALAWLVAHPEKLDLTGVDFAVLGAGAEMGPRSCCWTWARPCGRVDLPRPELWRRVIADAEGRAGRLMVPVPAGRPGSHAAVGISARGGRRRRPADPGARGPHLAGRDPPAVHARQLRLRRRRRCTCASPWRSTRSAWPSSRTGHDVMLAWLATPTDVFAVADGGRRGVAAALARRRYAGGSLRSPLRLHRVRSRRTTRPRSSPPTGSSTASPTAWSPSRGPTTSWPSGCSAGGPWRLARTVCAPR